MAENQEAIAQEFLEALGPDHVALPNSKEYDALKWYNSANYEAKPICLVTPSSASEVSTAIKLIKQKGLTFGIRSGGLHVCNGFSNADGGILISFERYMNKIRYEKGSKVAFLDPGARWSEVYEYFQPFGVQPVGGRATNIGVGGFLCGGGMSFLSSKYGLGCDNVESFEAVLASGEIVKATRTNEHKGLFFALKGGGNRFAVVTKFEVLVHPISNVYAGAVNLTPESIDKGLEVLHDFIENNEDENANVLFNLIEAGGQETSNIPRCYLLPEPPKTGSFASFESLEGTTSDGAAIPYKTVTDQTTFDCWGPHFWPFWQCATYKSSVALLKHCKAEFDALRVKVKEQGIDAWSVSMHFEPLSKKMVEIGYERGGNAFGASQDAPYFWCLVVFNCGSKAGQEKAAVLAGEYMKAVDAFAQKDRKDAKLNLEAVSSFPVSPSDIDSNCQKVPAIPKEATGLPLYPNNASPAQLPSVTTTALPLLQIAKQRYDPDGFFSKKQNGFSI